MGHRGRTTTARRMLRASVATVLAVLAAPSYASDRVAIQTEILALQERLAELQKQRRITAAAAMQAGSKPRSWKLPGTNTSLRIGGYAKLDFIYDINGAAGDQLPSASLPIDGTAAGNRQGNFRLHARQSQLWIQTWTPTDWGELNTYIEFDFYNNGGNQLISNSNSTRGRRFYARLGPLLAGQEWSTFMILEAVPRTVDFTGPLGNVFIRQAMIRYTHSFGGGTKLDFAVENPETGFVTSPGGLAVGGALSPSTDPLPDFVVKLSHSSPDAFVALAGLFRQLNVDDGGAAGLSSSTFAWAFNLGAWWRFNNKRTRIGGLIVGGRGVGRYALQGRSSAILNGTSSTNASLRAVYSVGGVAWIEHNFTDQVNARVAVARTFTDAAGANTTGARGKNGLGALVQDGASVHANVFWQVTPDFEIGTEYIYIFNGYINSADAHAHRIQIGFYYHF